MKKRIQWIESIRLIAAISVFFGHFYNMFYGMRYDFEMLEGTSRYIINACCHIVAILFSGDFWVFVFLFFGGFFAVQKKIDGLWSLIKFIVRRYIRFVVPMFFANMLAMLVHYTIGFRTQEFADLIGGSGWAQVNAPQFTVSGVVKSSLLLTNEYNAPFWVMKPIFFGSVIAYCYSFMKNCIKKLSVAYFEYMPEVVIVFLMWLVLVIPRLYTKWFYAMVFAAGGLVLYYAWTYLSVSIQAVWFPITLIALTFLQLDVYHPTDPRDLARLAFFFSLSLYYTGAIHKVLEHEWLEKINGLSFGIFAVHGSILFSLSIVIQMRLMCIMPYALCFCINAIVSLLIVLLISYVFHLLIERGIVDRLIL